MRLILSAKEIIWKKEFKNQLQIRWYTWADNPRGTNLYNKEGLPASPFQTEKVKE